jgi:hypothetical protein
LRKKMDRCDLVVAQRFLLSLRNFVCDQHSRD